MKAWRLHIGSTIVESTDPILMAVLNCWCDSFCTTTHLHSDDDLLRQADRALSHGARILDLGACPTHPGQPIVDQEKEWQSIDRAARLIRQHWPSVWLSVDTFRSQIARRAVEEHGVVLINDISGGQIDPAMFPTIAQLHVSYILTHMRGTPETMQQMTQYNHLMADIIMFLQHQLDQLYQLGASDIIIDPGFGFAKTLEQNYQLLAHLDELEVLGQPILVGLSRKSMLYRLLNISPEDTLNATTAAHLIALERGAAILRVHDVKEAAEAVKIYQYTKNHY